MIYAYVSLDISNPEVLAKYREVAADALAKHSGKVESATRETTILEGQPKRPEMAALLSFPDKERALAWANDPELHEVHSLRQASGTSDILLLG